MGTPPYTFIQPRDNVRRGFIHVQDWLHPCPDWLYPRADWLHPRADWLYPRADWLYLVHTPMKPIQTKMQAEVGPNTLF